MPDHFDVLIIGGGLVGLTLANVLANVPANVHVTPGETSALRVGVIERTMPDVVKPGDAPSNRVSAINYASEQVLRNTGVWDGLDHERVCAYRAMHVWDAGSMGSIHFDCEQMGVESLGHIIENAVLVSALRENLALHANVELMCPAQIESIAPHSSSSDADAWHVTLDSGEVKMCALLVGADGPRSMVRDAANIGLSNSSYRQLGIVCNVNTESPHEHTAWQRFLPGGPLAFLPMVENTSSIVWTLPDVEGKRVLALTDDAFADELAQAFDYQLGGVTRVSPRAAFPLGHGHAARSVGEGVALIGDAAHTIHPLAGQGANLGILDAACLCEVVLKALGEGRGIGNLSTLRRYERWRKGEILAMEYAMSAFDFMFSNSNPLLGLARSIGLNAADAITPLKHRMMSHAMGLKGDLPALATRASSQG